MAQLLPGDVLQVAFAVLLVVAGVRMILKGRAPDGPGVSVGDPPR
jgi:uncharacterized membrane protein YfcA